MNYSNVNAKDQALAEPSDLKFPDWSGMKSHDARLTPAEAFRWNDEMLKLFPPQEKSRRDSQSRCAVQFAL